MEQVKPDQSESTAHENEELYLQQFMAQDDGIEILKQQNKDLAKKVHDMETRLNSSKNLAAIFYSATKEQQAAMAKDCYQEVLNCIKFLYDNKQLNPSEYQNWIQMITYAVKNPQILAKDSKPSSDEINQFTMKPQGDNYIIDEEKLKAIKQQEQPPKTLDFSQAQRNNAGNNTQNDEKKCCLIF